MDEFSHESKSQEKSTEKTTKRERERERERERISGRVGGREKSVCVCSWLLMTLDLLKTFGVQNRKSMSP